MFKKIVVPVDLTHADRLSKALGVAADMASQHGAEVCYVGVTTSTPGGIARTPEEYTQKLTAFAGEQGESRGITTSSHTIISHDPSTQMNRELEAAVEKLGADLVIMASHVPNVSDYVWSGHGAHIAAHSPVSVMLVRD
ncbi:universal stress protein [Amaricoccus tamworthensis]|uniref:universal stress protein n=1 Tax=Amaricoccus tamworthensis TaxID=57002 RepID=UPI003C7C27E2